MPYVLGPIKPDTSFETAGQTLSCPLSIGATVMVEWAPVYIQVAPERKIRGEPWEPAELLPRGYHSISRYLSAIRVRAALEFVPVLVTIRAVKNYE